MSRKTPSNGIHYFDVSAGLIALAVVIASFFITTRQSWSWNYKDLLGFGLFLFVGITFILLRRQAYEQRTPWLLFCFSALAVTAMVILFRRWSLIWVGVAAAILPLGLLIRSRTIPQISYEAVFFSLLLIAGSVLLTLVLIEGTLRLFPDLLSPGARLRINWRSNENPWHVPHPYIGHLHIADGNASARTARPGIEATGVSDIWGFRNTWPWPEQVDIVAVGDSWTYSQMVDDEQAWTTLLAQALPHNQILNLGLIGGAPQQYLRIYETFGIKLAPKVLLVGLFLGNDLWGAGKFDLWWRSGGKGSFPEFGRPEDTPGVWGWVARGVESSYVFALLRDFSESYQSGRFLGGKTVELASGTRLQLVPSFLAQDAKYAQPGHPEFILVLETLDRIHTIAKQHKTQCLVLFFPSKEEVYLPLLGEEAVDLAAPFIPELDKRGIAYLDLGPYFRRRAAAGEALFWELDGHPNAHGYALIAEIVLAHLKDNAQRYGLKD
jgi:lysophospholipase L1-like esterase